MVNYLRHIHLGSFWGGILTFHLIFGTIQGFGQAHLISEVSISKSSAYIGEPIEVTISVYSTTWFTKGIQLENIQVDNAFSVYFRSLSTRKETKGKTYSGVQFFYHVFPYQEGQLTFPSVTFKVETPDEGDYKGISRTVKTNARQIQVKAIPSEFKTENWLVASSVSISETWSSDLSNIKVGDVVVRNVSRQALGTVAELLYPIQWDTLSDVSTYPSRSSVKNHRSKTSISASRTDNVRYLFEKEGEVILPEIVQTWWNPYQKKLFKKTLPKRTIKVSPNPNLNILKSTKDSLEVSSLPVTLKDDSNNPLKQLKGLPWKMISGSLIALYIILKFLLRPCILIFNRLFNILQSAVNSEAFAFISYLFFRLFVKKTKSLNLFYKWISHLRLKEPTLTFFLNTLENDRSESRDSERQTDPNQISSSRLIKARIHYHNNTSNRRTSPSNSWINPD